MPSGGNAAASLSPFFSLLPLSLHPGAVGALQIQALTPSFHKRGPPGWLSLYVEGKENDSDRCPESPYHWLPFFLPWLSWWILFKERGYPFFVSLDSPKDLPPFCPVLPLGWPGWEWLEKRPILSIGTSQYAFLGGSWSQLLWHHGGYMECGDLTSFVLSFRP